MSRMQHGRQKENNYSAAVTGVLITGGMISAVTASPAHASGNLTPAQIASAAKAGCPQLTPSALNIAVKIAMAESSGNPGAYGDGNTGGSVGLWQIHRPSHPSLFPMASSGVVGNAKAMCAVSRGGTNWRPWSTYTNGMYLSRPGWTGAVASAPAAKPPAPTAGGYTITVRPGDWLSKIAKRELGDAGKWKAIHDANRATIGPNANRIYAGQKLTIPGQRTAAPAPPVRTAPAPSAKAVLPVKGRIGDNLIVRGNCISRTCGGHSGLDISAPYGTPVLAAMGGTVVNTYGAGAAYGTYVVIKHSDGTHALYAHMSGRAVGVGQAVAAGQKIGTVGSSGVSSGPHLHLELRRHPTAFSVGNFLNPVAWLRSHGVVI